MMKHYYITPVIAAVSALGLSAQTHVSTEPSPRAILIEEYTGVNCGNCPEGHERAHQLRSVNPGVFYSVAIHAGHYAEAAINFVVPVGQAIHDKYCSQAYPTADINRYDPQLQYDAGYAIGRSSWGPVGWQLHSVNAPVNLWAESSYDESTRKLTINIEGYFTEDMEKANLSAYLLQSDIIAFQSGAENRDSYHHDHMLRDAISDVWGDAIDNPKKGEYFTKTYTYEVAEKYNAEPMVMADASIIVFVTNEEGIVENVTETYPELNGTTGVNRVNFEAWMLAPGNIWGFNFVEGLLENRTADTITSATFEVTCNGKTETVEWTGSVLPHSSQKITIPLSKDQQIEHEAATTTLSAKLLKANGKEIEGSKTTSMSANVRGANPWPTTVKVNIRTDNSSDQNTWRILDADGNIVKEFGPFPVGEITEITEELEFEDGKTYCFEVFDCIGNGVKDPRGQVIFRDSNDKLLGQMKEIESFGNRQFFYASETAAVSSLESERGDMTYSDGIVTATDNASSVAVYDLSGAKVAEGIGSVSLQGLSKGAYIAVSNGRTLKIAL